MLPDILEIQPPKRPPNAIVTVPGSKSVTNRALVLAALARGKCTLRGALWADDTQVLVDALQRLGFKVAVTPDLAEECNRTIEVEGCDGRIPARRADLFVGNAGTAARFLTALVALGRGEYTITGDPRMHERPMADLFDGLDQLGVQITANQKRLPATIHSTGLKSGKVRVSAKLSSQFASALLLIQRHAGIVVELAEPDEPHGYIEMTERMIESFQPGYTVEPDLSSASYFVAAGWLTRGSIEVAGWPKQSLQVDGRFPEFLPPPRAVSRLRELGDGVMTLAVCALFGEHPMQLTQAGRMRAQECDRLRALATELQRVGAHAEETEDGLIVYPARPDALRGAEIETYNDHRMAMCFAVLGLKIPGIRIKNPQCVRKTFPNFFDKLKQLGAGLLDVNTGKRI
jgi:3-phosphoshikimate 1-carboxyvinyltransferase